MEIAVNVKPIQFPTDPLNEVFAAVVQASSKEMAVRVTHYVLLQRIAFGACSQVETRGNFRTGRELGHKQGHLPKKYMYIYRYFHVMRVHNIESKHILRKTVKTSCIVTYGTANIQSRILFVYVIPCYKALDKKRQFRLEKRISALTEQQNSSSN
jgi:hypothetical protein